MPANSIERYETARHEAIHCLAARAYGNDVISIDIARGETLVQWPCHPHDIDHLLQVDPARAARAMQSVIITCAAPSLDVHEPTPPGDRAVIDKYSAYWTLNDPSRHQLYCASVWEARHWLARQQTQDAIAKFTQLLFVEESLRGDELARALSTITSQPATAQPTPLRPSAQPPRPPTRVPVLTPEEQREAEQRLAMLEDRYGLKRTVFRKTCA